MQRQTHRLAAGIVDLRAQSGLWPPRRILVRPGEPPDLFRWDRVPYHQAANCAKCQDRRIILLAITWQAMSPLKLPAHPDTARDLRTSRRRPLAAWSNEGAAAYDACWKTADL